MGETRQLAAFSSGWNLDRCPPPVLAQAKRCVLETLGCALGGSRTPLTAAAARSIQRQAEGGCATVLGLGFRAAPDRAAFLNGISANALDFDGGIVRQGHYGPTVVGSALAMGELVQASGRQMLEAVIVGYEVVTRVSMALRASAECRRLVSGYGPYQGFGSVAAAAHLLRLDAEQTTQAFGLYGAFAPVASTKQCNWDNRPLSWTKDMVAWPSVSGINAALLAESGFQGPSTIFEGDRGFFRMAGSDRYDPALLVAGLGEQFNILGLYFKPYPCCRWHHAALDGIRGILEQRRWAGSDVARVRVGVAQEVVEDLSDASPRNLVDAQFSMPYVVAMVLLGIPPGPAWHDPALPGSAQVQAAMAKVTLQVDPRMETLFNEQSVVGAVVQVQDRAGSLADATVECAHGDQMQPMSDAQLEAKFRLLAAGVIPDADAGLAVQRIQDLEQLDRIASLAALLAG
jgi:2-methylcitrate dehydratase PrpD